MRRNTESRKADEKSSLADNSNLKKKSRAAAAQLLVLFCGDNFFRADCIAGVITNVLPMFRNSGYCIQLSQPADHNFAHPFGGLRWMRRRRGQVLPTGSRGSTFSFPNTLHAARASRMEKASPILRWRSGVWARRAARECFNKVGVRFREEFAQCLPHTSRHQPRGVVRMVVFVHALLVAACTYFPFLSTSTVVTPVSVCSRADQGNRLPS